jgi:uncharacterized protein DUF5666
VAALAASTVACGGSMSATGPSGTSRNGAVISGRVTMTGSAATVATTTPLALLVLPVVPMAGSAASTVTVTVVGTGASTTIDGSGSFTLDNVPPGSVQLRFQGRGADATLTISGIEANDHISIAVTLNGNNARLDKREKTGGSNGNEVNGRIDSIDAAAHTLRADGMTVIVQSSTIIRHGNRTFAFADLRVGDHIEAKGTRNGTTLTASEIKVETGDDEDDDNELRGAVSALAGTCPVVSFTVAGTKVVTTATTRFEDGSCSGLKNDLRVEVEGTRAGDTLTATKVEFD